MKLGGAKHYVVDERHRLTPSYSSSMVGLIVSLHRYRKSIVVVIDEGVVFGGRFVRWGDVDDVRLGLSRLGRRRSRALP